MLTYDEKQIMVLHRWLVPAMLFVLIVMVSRLDVIVEALKQENGLAYGWTLEFVMESLKSDAALFAAPILCNMPYAAALIEELKSGAVKAVLVRTKKDRYLFSKAAACFLSGGLEALASAALICLIAVVMFMHLEVLPEQGMNQNAAIGMFIGMLCRYGCFGAFWSLAGLGISLFTMNKIMAWIGPFIADYLLIIVYERYFGGLQLFYPKEWLLLSWEWPLADYGVCLWLLLLCGIILLVILYRGKKVLADAL